MEICCLVRRPRPFPSGIGNGRLPNKYITASSIWDRNHAAWLARLHRKKQGRYVGGWSARHNNRLQWIQFDLRGYKRIYKVATQGRQDINQWVTKYKIAYSQNGRRWVFYKKYSRVVVFGGNRDRNTVKENILRPRIVARYVRIYPVSWHGHISLRAEFYIRNVCKYLKRMQEYHIVHVKAFNLFIMHAVKCIHVDNQRTSSNHQKEM